jgi:hypothetical protein
LNGRLASMFFMGLSVVVTDTFTTSETDVALTAGKRFMWRVKMDIRVTFDDEKKQVYIVSGEEYPEDNGVSKTFDEFRDWCYAMIQELNLREGTAWNVEKSNSNKKREGGMNNDK